MIICYIGTRAQLIKMAPVIVEIERKGMPLCLVMTGQHKETMAELMMDFGIKSERRYIYEGPEITGIVQMAFWFVSCVWKVLKNHRHFLPRSMNEKSVILVHGDTFSTLLGAVVGKLKGVDVAHVEAGLRSNNIFHPFPEELTRLLVFRLANIAFCPGQWAFKNMGKYKLKRIDIKENTLRDAADVALKASLDQRADVSEESFAVVSLHRFENIFFKRRLLDIIVLVEQVSEKYKLFFVLHPATRKRLSKYGLLARLESNENIVLLPRMGYVRFINLIKEACFVITDGGGNQEELSYLGVPTLLMRKTTERKEGLGSTAVVAAYDQDVVNDFIEGVGKKTRVKNICGERPSTLIVDYLQSRLI